MDGPSYIQPLITLLFERDARHLTDRLRELIENNYAKGNPKEGFLYGGRFHTLMPLLKQRTAMKKLLHPSLREEGRLYLEEVSLLEAESKRVTHGLGIILRPCASAQDVRDVLPNTVAKLLPDLAQLPRQRDPGWPFQDQPFQLHQFNETVQMLEYYVSNRIL